MSGEREAIELRNKNVFWGVFFMAAAVLVLLNQFFYFPINIFQLLVSIFLVSIIVKSIPRRQFFGIFIPIALLASMFGGSLFHMSNRVTWSLLVSAVCMSIAMSIFFKKKSVYYFDYDSDFHHVHTESSETNSSFPGERTTFTQADDNFVQCHVSFSGKSHYSHAKNLEKANLSCNFGELKVYFDQATLGPNGADINVDCSFGSMQLYLPRSWNVANNLSSTLGSIEENYHPQQGEGPQVVLNGGVSLGSIQIFYV